MHYKIGAIMKFSSLATLALSLTLMTSVFAGSESGGGGDAVTKKDQLVLRDFLEGSSFDTVLDNEAFLRKTPGFVELMSEISLADPALAATIMQDLTFNVTFYYSTMALPILSSKITTLSGAKADVQLAIRKGKDIYLAPSIKKPFKDMPYLLVHESLHSIILKNENTPEKHQKIRTVVNFLKKNRGDFSDLSKLLAKMDAELYIFDIDRPEEVNVSTEFMDSVVMNKNVDESIRCYWAFKRTKGRTHPFNWLQNLNCSSNDANSAVESASLDMEKFIKKNPQYQAYFGETPFIKTYSYEQLKALSCAQLVKEHEEALRNYSVEISTIPATDLTGNSVEDITVKAHLNSDQFRKLQDFRKETAQRAALDTSHQIINAMHGCL
jgi:hypothetical protein